MEVIEKRGITTSNGTEFDFANGRLPFGSPVSTRTCAVTALANNVAGIVAVI
jgi:hypothetical protein